jgi:hypothetical protein
MSPTAEGADLTVPPEAAAPGWVLRDGEVVILALKPSAWFVLLTSWPVLAAAALVALGGYVAHALWPGAVVRETLLLVCILAGACRIIVACFHWGGRLYVLTNRRALWIFGYVRPSVSAMALKDVSGTCVSASRLERLASVGTLAFQRAGADSPGPAWVHIARARQVRQIVDDAIRRAR